MAFILAMRHSVPDDSHSASTESSESLNVGTHLTSLSVTATGRPESSIAVNGMSPMAVHVWGRPSMPAPRSSHARMFTRSEMWGWMCHVHPLSTMKPTLRCPSRRLRLRRAVLRRALVASMARAGVAMRADVLAVTAALPVGAVLACLGSAEGATVSPLRRRTQLAKHVAATEEAQCRARNTVRYRARRRRTRGAAGSR
eukprot:3255911-Pleurochrysis_carterae.AAC.2